MAGIWILENCKRQTETSDLGCLPSFLSFFPTFFLSFFLQFVLFACLFPFVVDPLFLRKLTHNLESRNIPVVMKKVMFKNYMLIPCNNTSLPSIAGLLQQVLCTLTLVIKPAIQGSNREKNSVIIVFYTFVQFCLQTLATPPYTVF